MMIYSTIRACFRLVFVFAWLLLWLLPMVLLSWFRIGGLLPIVARFCARGLLFISNIKATTTGEVLAPTNKDRATLLVGNHISYLDILALNILFGCAFISKSDVASWPIFGTIAKAQRTIFVRRASRASLPETQKEMQQKLFENRAYVLFAEGTSSDGSYILPFRSNLLQGAVGNDRIYLQSFCVQYRSCNGLPIIRGKRALFAWYGDMELLPHLWDLLHIDSAHVEIRLAAPIKGSEYPDRKSLTQALQDNTENLLQDFRQGEDE